MITLQQKERLKQLLTEEEYNNIMTVETDIEKFQDLLDDYIFDRFDGNQEPTPESWELQKVYDEIYNQI